MKGIELAITEDGNLAIRCLEHDRTHTGSMPFCCNDVMVRAMTMALQRTPDGYHARILGIGKPEGLTGQLFDIATTPLLAFNPTKGGSSPIDQN